MSSHDRALDYEYALRNTKTGKLRSVTTSAVHVAFLCEAFKAKGFEMVRREVGPWEAVTADAS